MTKHSPENERIKRKYYAYLKEAKRYSEDSVDAAAKALSRFEVFNRNKDFKAFHFEQAVAFKRNLSSQISQQSGGKLSKATQHATLSYLKQFFFWLADQPGYRARLQYTDADYFNLSEKDTRIATAHRERPAPTIEQVKQIIMGMPVEGDIALRNRALVAFTLLTGARDSATASVKLKHIDLTVNCFHQDAREVKTKFSKTFSTYFFPVGDDILSIFKDWVDFLRKEKLWGEDDPLFPATTISLSSNHLFEATGLDRKHWSTATPIRTIFREACSGVGLPYFHPHSLRKTLARLGEQRCNTPEEFKAWSQNLGHDQVLTTFTSYGSVRSDRQGEIIRNLAPSEIRNPEDAIRALQRVASMLEKNGLSELLSLWPDKN